MDRLKIIFFLIFIALIIFFPLTQRDIKVSKIDNKDSLPIIILDGNFSYYEGNLTKKADFKKAIVLNKEYILFYLNFFDIKNSYEIFAKKSTYKDNLIKGFFVKFFSKEYNLTTNYANYNTITKLLKGDKFNLYALNFRGFGDSFEIDKNKNIKAFNIEYFLKVKR